MLKDSPEYFPGLLDRKGYSLSDYIILIPAILLSQFNNRAVKYFGATVAY